MIGFLPFVFAALEFIRTNEQTSSISSEVEIALIILGILAATICVLFLLKKLGIFNAFSAKGKEDEEKSVSTEKTLNEPIQEVVKEEKEISHSDLNSKSNQVKKHRHHHRCKKHMKESDCKERDKTASSFSNKGENMQQNSHRSGKHRLSPEKKHTYSSQRNGKRKKRDSQSSRRRENSLTRPSMRKAAKSSDRKSHNNCNSKNKGGSIPIQTDQTNYKYRPSCREPRKRRTRGPPSSSEETSTEADSSDSCI